VIKFTGIPTEDDFFIAHLERFTQLTFDHDVKIIAKSAGYPDLHGDYPACAIMQISEKDMASLTSLRLKGYDEVEVDRAYGPCLKAINSPLKRLFYKQAPGELIYVGYNAEKFEVFFDYYSH
jgi:hypothetical protein